MNQINLNRLLIILNYLIETNILNQKCNTKIQIEIKYNKAFLVVNKIVLTLIKILSLYNSKQKKSNNLFTIKLKKISLTILKKKLYIIKRFFQKSLTKSANAKFTNYNQNYLFFSSFNNNKHLNFFSNARFKYY